MKKNVLKGIRCYLCGSMENSDGQPWREIVKKELKSTGIVFFDPYNKPFVSDIPENKDTIARLKNQLSSKRFDDVAKYMRKVRGEDLRLTDICDFSIISVSPKIASWGTGEEITRLNISKKPIFVFIDGGKKLTPLWIMGMIPHKYIYDSVDDVIKMIKRIDSGRKKIDSDRWRLLKKEYL